MSVDRFKMSAMSGSRTAPGAVLRLAIAFLMLQGAWLHGQEPTFSTNVKVVNVLATVRNKQGQIVRNLTKDDFTLTEDNRPQTIRYFAQESDLPLTLGLLVDTSLSQARVLDEERDASYTFLDQMLREKDVAFVIHFEGQVELLQDLTSSRKDLEAALRLLRTPQLQRYDGGGGPNGGYGTPFAAAQWPGGMPGQWPGGGGGRQGRRMPPGGGRGAGGGTALYDAVFLASDEVIKKQPGRKALIVLSDGVDNSSKVSLDRAIESALRADTLVYSIRFHDDSAYGSSGGLGGIGGMGRRGGGGYPPSYPSSRPDGKKVLERLSNETGGRFFDVSKKQTVSQIYSIIQEELRNQYSLGYTPDRPDAGPPYRKIQVTTRQKDVTVRARDGYYAQ